MTDLAHEPPTSIDDATDEPYLSIERLVADHGAGATLRALARVLHKARTRQRTEGELDAARALGCAYKILLDQSVRLRNQGM